MSPDLRRSAFAPWAGWLGAPAAWALHHQAGSDLAFAATRCQDGAPQLWLGLACAAIAAAGGWLSWRSRGADLRAGEFDLRTFVALVGAMAGGVFLLAILFQLLASAIVPPCHAG